MPRSSAGRRDALAAPRVRTIGRHAAGATAGLQRGPGAGGATGVEGACAD
jgi:hypothetical protein